MTQAVPQTTTTAPDEAARLMRLATYASSSVAVTLIVLKLVAWGFSDSISLLATLVDSTLDLLASLINLVAVRHALQPADKQHRFGHGKAEALAGLGQATFIAGSAIFLLLEAGRRFWLPVPVQAYELGIAVMFFSLVATIALVLFQRHVIRKTGSTAIKADALHYRTDILVNGSVILALWLSVQGWPGFDPLFAVLIAIYILYSAREIIIESYEHLMDRELPDAEREQIKEIVHQHAEVRGMHDLRTRRSGTSTFMQLHLELDDDLLLTEAHKICDEVELLLQEAFPEAEIIIHTDPISVVPDEPLPDFLDSPADD